MKYEEIEEGMIVLVEAEIIEIREKHLSCPIKVKLPYGFLLRPEEVKSLKVAEPEEKKW